MNRSRLLLAGTLAIASLAPAATAAAARGERTALEAFPSAMRLCSATAGGTGSARLRPLAGQVLTACSTLETSFQAAETAFADGQAAIAAARAEAGSGVHAACTGEAGAAASAACSQAREVSGEERRSLNEQHRELLRARAAAILAARQAFWSSLRAVRQQAAALQPAGGGQHS
jgi:hypothetical protein